MVQQIIRRWLIDARFFCNAVPWLYSCRAAVYSTVPVLYYYFWSERYTVSPPLFFLSFFLSSFEDANAVHENVFDEPARLRVHVFPFLAGVEDAFEGRQQVLAPIPPGRHGNKNGAILADFWSAFENWPILSSPTTWGRRQYCVFLAVSVHHPVCARTTGRAC